MLCPLKLKREHTGEQMVEHYPRDSYFGLCDKEDCAWWINKKVNGKYTSGCSVAIIAKVHKFIIK